MTLAKFLPISIFIGIQAASVQIIDQVLSPHVSPCGNSGFGWIAFLAWAVYFVAGCTPKGGVRSFLGFLLGCVASIVIIAGGTAFVTMGLGFWAMPAMLALFVPVILYLDQAPELISFVPSTFIGAGAFFGFMTYVDGACFTGALVTEMIYCTIGLVFGWITVVFRTWYEKKYVTAK